MSKWTNGKLDLGRLGYMRTFSADDGRGRTEVWWELLCNKYDDTMVISKSYRTEAAAQTAAIRWLRAALKQAAKRLEK